MARRRKVSTTSTTVKKPATRRSTRKTNGLPEDNPNGSVSTVDAEEEEETPPTEEKPALQSAQPSSNSKEAVDTPSTTVVHKKFGKINCMLPDDGQNQSSPEPEEHIPSLQQPLHVEEGASIPVRRRTRASIQDARLMVEMVLLQEEQAASQIREEEEVIEEEMPHDEHTVIVDVNQEEIVYTEEVSASVWQAETLDVEMYENTQESEDTGSQDEKVTEDESENCTSIQEEVLEQPLSGELEDSNDEAEAVKNLNEISNVDQERSTSTTSFSNHFHSSLDSDTSDKEMDEDESLRNKLSPDEITQMVLGMNCGNIELNVEHQLCKRQEEPEISRLNNGAACNSVPSSKSEPVGPIIGTISRQKNSSTQSGSGTNRDKSNKSKDSKSAVIPLNSVKTPPRKHVICIDDSPIKSPDKLNSSQDGKDINMECSELPLSSIGDNLFSADLNVLNELSIRREEEDKPIIKQRQRLLDEDSFHTKKNSGNSDAEPERKRMGSFRSRSGSSDTTGSDSGSGSPSVRRSTRVRTSSTFKQCGDSKVAVENSDSSSENPTAASLPTVLGSPTVQTSIHQDASMPVKVKSRWRRSSELEMGGIRPLDPDTGAPPLQPSSPQADCPTSPCAPPSPRDSSGSKQIKHTREEELREIEERLRNYEILVENQYLTERTRSKGEKRMVCDCTLTKEEISRGEMGCGEDCLNRLLMIECGSRCAVKDRCSNKRFQNAEYSSCEIFKTEKKGLGLRAVQDLPAGSFIMEYVGEVLDPREFRKRAKEYSKDQNRHYYFMALKSDAIIDATTKGNNSRFINHSCDPNSETQKWTVNGELRIGFFTTKTVAAGEEITFDYQFQRYGKEAQRCFCESSVCRGWIGGEPDKDKSRNQWHEWKEKDTTSTKKKRDKDRDRDRDRERDSKRREDMDLEEEIEKLCSSGLKSRAHTLTLCRLMVRAEDAHSRSLLLRLLRDGEPACRRLFLDYHGLRLIWSWMIDTNTAENIQAKTEILRTLRKLPIPNKTMLMDSKVWSVVDRWSELKPKLSNPVPPAAPNSASVLIEKDDRTSADGESSNDVSEKSESVEDKSPDDGDESTKGMQHLNTPLVEKMEVCEEDTKPPQPSMLPGEGESVKPSEDATIAEDVKQLELGVREAGIKQDASDEDRVEEKKIGANGEVCTIKSESNEENSPEEVSCAEIAALLLQDWAALKEVFRIPKKERIEQMKEHEREADQHYSELDRDSERQSYDRHDRYDRYRDDRRKRSRESPDHDRRSRPRIEERREERSRYEDRRHDDRSRYEGRSRYGENVRHDDSTRTEERPIDVRLSKEARRKAFALKVQQEEEEREARRVQAEKEAEEQKQAQEEWWRYHEERCRQLGLDPHVTAAIFHTQYFDPLSNQWVPYAHPPDPNCPPGTFPSEMGPHPHVYPSDPNNPIPPQMAGSPFPGIFPSLPSHPGLPGHPGQPGQPVPFDPNHLPPGVSPVPPAVVLPGLPPGVAPAIQEVPTTEPGIVLPSVTQTADPQQPVYPEDPFNRPQDPVLPAFPLTDTQQQQPPQLSPSQLQQQQQVPVPYMPVPVQLPPKWKSAKDAEGRTYYYHVKTRVSQWEPPPWVPAVAQTVESESSSTSSDEENDEDEDDSDSSEEEDKQQDEEEEEREEEDEEDEAADDAPAVGLGMAAHHQQQMRADPDYPNFSPRPSAAEERKKRRVGLVQEHIISPRREEDRTNPKVYKEIKEKLRRQKEKRRQKEREGKSSKRRHRDGDKLRTSHSLEKPVTVAADTSSDAARRIKDQFRLNMAGVIVQHLNPYRKPDCRIGRITNTEDFKHLARKLTHFVMLKELKHCRNVDDLECNDNVKHKARDFIKKYMAKFGEIYQRPKDDD